MKQLHPFIPSPRAGKRFINIYRLLRASAKSDELTTFEGDDKGGPYQSAMLLLGMLTAHPEQATEVFRRLMQGDSVGNWANFLKEFRESVVRELTRQEEMEAKRLPAESNISGNRKSWNEMFSNLDSIHNVVWNRPIEEFQVWAPRVARYSFQSGRVLHYEHE